MNRFITLLLFAILFASVSCTTRVGKNNQEANGDTKSTTTVEDQSDKADNPQAESNSAENSAADKDPKSPDGLVEDLYKQSDNENSPFFQDTKRELVDKYFVKSLADMIWKDSVESKDEVGALDFDPLYNAQDTEIAELKVGTAEIKAEKATVNVTFLNFGEEQTIKYLLAKENGDWKIEDIDYGEDTLVKVFKEEPK